MKTASIFLGLFAVAGMAGFTATAALLPPSCPRGFHAVGANACQSDDTHIAPSSGAQIPNAVVLGLDSHVGLRAALATAGAALLSGLMWIFTSRHAVAGARLE